MNEWLSSLTVGIGIFGSRVTLSLLFCKPDVALSANRSYSLKKYLTSWLAVAPPILVNYFVCVLIPPSLFHCASCERMVVEVHRRVTFSYFWMTLPCAINIKTSHPLGGITLYCYFNDMPSRSDLNVPATSTVQRDKRGLGFKMCAVRSHDCCSAIDVCAWMATTYHGEWHCGCVL